MTSSQQDKLLHPTVEQLNWQFALQGGRLEFQEDSTYGGLIVATLRDPGRRVSARVSLLGAQVLSLILPDTADLLYLSSKSKFESGVPIRGGIPIILGWFGKREGAPSHGFGRLLTWWPIRASVEANKTILTLRVQDANLAENSQVAKDPLWGTVPFTAELGIVLSDSSLELNLSCTHRSSKAIPFQAGFHPYFVAGDYRHCMVRGFEHLSSVDCLQGRKSIPARQSPLQLSGAIDSIFLGEDVGIPQSCILSDPSLKRELTISQSGLKNWVVWNPGDDFAKNAAWAADIDDNRGFVCVEPVTAAETVELSSNSVFSCSMGIRLTSG